MGPNSDTFYRHHNQVSRVLKLWISAFVLFYTLFFFFVSVVVCLFVYLPGAVFVFVGVSGSGLCCFRICFVFFLGFFSKL